MKRRVHLIHTGGTIGMARGSLGWEPRPGHLAEQIAGIPELRDPSMPRIDVHEIEPLLDSANMAPEDWTRIAKHLEEHYDEADGFVILHGTDTMAYTASALPFMLHGLAKPVVLTGSQIPLGEVRNDARGNLITSLMLAARSDFHEVGLFFGNRLFRGCRATKVDAEAFKTFDSPNYPALAHVGVHIELRPDLLWRGNDPKEPFHVRAAVAPPVGALRLFPGISATVLENLLRPPLRGLVLETYGVGNGPARDRRFLEVLAEASSRGVVIVAVSQCLRGGVDLAGYATGSALAAAGVSSGLDLTKEAALAKLSVLLGEGHEPQEVRNLMATNLRGELSPAS